jgi:hypothetical protein
MTRINNFQYQIDELPDAKFCQKRKTAEFACMKCNPGACAQLLAAQVLAAVNTSDETNHKIETEKAEIVDCASQNHPQMTQNQNQKMRNMVDLNLELAEADLEFGNAGHLKKNVRKIIDANNEK